MMADCAPLAIEVYNRLAPMLECLGLGMVREACSYNFTITATGEVLPYMDTVLSVSMVLQRDRRILVTQIGVINIYVTPAALEKIRDGRK